MMDRIRLKLRDLEVGKLADGEPIISIDKAQGFVRTLDKGSNSEIRVNCYEISEIRDEALLMFNEFTEIFPGEKNYEKYRAILDKSPRGQR